jgi:hypothetical protein
MKKIFLLTLILISPLAHADSERMRLQVEYIENGKSILKPTFFVYSGHSAEIENGDVFLKVTPIFLPGKTKGQIDVKLEIRQGISSGNPTALSPRLIALEGEEAKMEMVEKDASGKQLSSYAVNVIAVLD